MPDSKIRCPLCSSSCIEPFSEDQKRKYLCCAVCLLVFVPVEFHLTNEQEKAVYDMHQNDSSDPGYRRFLSRLFDPMSDQLRGSERGLDFGCGPTPTLAEMFEGLGCCVSLYDKYYFPRDESLKGRYEFITASEVVEHLASPEIVLDQLWAVLETEGYLGIMTKRWLTKRRFNQWHYKNDATHIGFFHQQSFEWLAKKWGADLNIIGPDVVIFKKLVNSE